MKKYTIYCTKEQTRKALELGAPINFNKVGEGFLPLHNIISREKGGYYEIFQKTQNAFICSNFFYCFNRSKFLYDLPISKHWIKDF